MSVDDTILVQIRGYVNKLKHELQCYGLRNKGVAVDEILD